MVVKISLLCFASQFGKKISKLSFVESVYFLARMVKGQDILKTNKIIPSANINPIPIQVYKVILLTIPEYKT